jgi:hypothetical protein
MNTQSHPRLRTRLCATIFILIQKDLAIKNYEKSVELNPNNKNGADMLQKLKGE